MGAISTLRTTAARSTRSSTQERGGLCAGATAAGAGRRRRNTALPSPTTASSSRRSASAGQLSGLSGDLSSSAHAAAQVSLEAFSTTSKFRSACSDRRRWAANDSVYLTESAENGY